MVATAPCHFPNGLALSPDGAWLYVAESTLPGVTRLRTGGDGALGAPEEVVRLPGTVPDGLAFDAEGALYVSCYRPDRIYRVRPGGAIDVLADDPAGTALAAPTNVAFLGDGWLGVANLGRWHLAALAGAGPGRPPALPGPAGARGAPVSPDPGTPRDAAPGITEAQAETPEVGDAFGACLLACWEAAPGPGRRLS